MCWKTRKTTWATAAPCTSDTPSPRRCCTCYSSSKRAVIFSVWGFSLISPGSPHVHPTVELAQLTTTHEKMLYESRCRIINRECGSFLDSVGRWASPSPHEGPHGGASHMRCPTANRNRIDPHSWVITTKWPGAGTSQALPWPPSTSSSSYGAHVKTSKIKTGGETKVHWGVALNPSAPPHVPRPTWGCIARAGGQTRSNRPPLMHC